MKRVDDSKKEKPPKTIEEVGAMLQGLAYEIDYLVECIDLVVTRTASLEAIKPRGGELAWAREDAKRAADKLPLQVEDLIERKGELIFPKGASPQNPKPLSDFEFRIVNDALLANGYIYAKINPEKRRYVPFWFKPKPKVNLK